ncbi:AAA family ATPase [Acinetobacter pittii]|uniref:AAA family ATPase n=1 Tax=Acinetobacter pittii TaxID=48296 RepID=UPI0033335558
MIRSYWFKNYKSFKEEAVVDLTCKPSIQGPYFVKGIDGKNISLASCLIGPNAGGKTTALKPLVLLGWLIDQSFKINIDDKIPCSPHFFQEDEPTELGYEFSNEAFHENDDSTSRIYRYIIIIKDGYIIEEKLSVKSSTKFSYIIERKWDFEKKEFVIKSKIKELVSLPAFKNRNNVSLLSLLKQSGFKDFYFLEGLIKNINLGHSDNFEDSSIRVQYMPNFMIFKLSKKLYDDSDLRNKINTIVRSLDMGVSSIEAKQYSFGDTENNTMLIATHTQDGDTKILPVFQESAGTQSLIVFLSEVLPILEKGGIVVVDELESNLHPHVMEFILKIFAHSKWNKNKAQIIFTSHAINIINNLEKEQIYMVEKYDCDSELWRLDQIENVRREDNFAAKYLAGAFGALPNI